MTQQLSCDRKTVFVELAEGEGLIKEVEEENREEGIIVIAMSELSSLPQCKKKKKKREGCWKKIVEGREEDFLWGQEALHFD